jgi:hypothetical protein
MADVTTAIDAATLARPPVSIIADLFVDGGVVACRIVSLTDTNAELEVDENLELRQGLVVDLGGFGSADAYVLWKQGCRVGVRFIGDASALREAVAAEIAQLSRMDEKRRFARTTVLWSGSVAVGDRNYPCMIRDISAGGARITLRENGNIDPWVLLKIDRFNAYACKVAWRTVDDLGLRFAGSYAEMARQFGDVLPMCRVVATA